MELFWKGIGGILIALILGLNIGKREKDMALLLNMAVCCLGVMAILFFLDPVVEMVQELQALLPGKDGVISLLLKITGIALVSEVSEMICRDAGSASLGKLVQMLGNAVILWLSVPIFRNLVSIMQEILGSL